LLDLAYVVIGLYTVSSFKVESVFTAAGLMIIFRSVLGRSIFTGLYSYFPYAGTVRHIDRLAGLTASTATFPQTPPNTALSLQTISQQASLSASKELTGAILIAAAVLLAAVALSKLFRALNTKDRIFDQ
jgi:hypothetical protein